MQIEDKQDHTLCILSSPAPILELVEDLSISTLFTTEIEAALTTRRLTSEIEPIAFEQWMTSTAPLNTYAASLRMVKRKLLKANSLNAIQVQLLRMISAETAALEADLYPDGLPTFKRI